MTEPTIATATQEFGGGRRIILGEDLGPALIGVAVRASTTAPGRVKVALTSRVKDPDGRVHPVLCGTEFRLEMN